MAIVIPTCNYKVNFLKKKKEGKKKNKANQGENIIIIQLKEWFGFSFDLHFYHEDMFLFHLGDEERIIEDGNGERRDGARIQVMPEDIRKDYP